MAYGDDKLGSRVTGKGEKHIYDTPKTRKKIEMQEMVFRQEVRPHVHGKKVGHDHLTIDRNVGGEIVALTIFLFTEGKASSMRVDEVRQQTWIRDPGLLEDSPQDFIDKYGPGLIDMTRLKYRTEQKAKDRAKLDASEAWMSDDQREVIRSLAE